MERYGIPAIIRILQIILCHLLLMTMFNCVYFISKVFDVRSSILCLLVCVHPRYSNHAISSLKKCFLGFDQPYYKFHRNLFRLYRIDDSLISVSFN